MPISADAAPIFAAGSVIWLAYFAAIFMTQALVGRDLKSSWWTGGFCNLGRAVYLIGFFQCLLLGAFDALGGFRWIHELVIDSFLHF